MRFNAKITGVAKMQRDLLRHAEKVGREAISVVKQEARGLAIAYGAETSPPAAGGQGAVDGFKKRIEADVARVYVKRENPGAVYRLLEKHSPELARAYWAAHKAQQPRRMAVILRKAGLPQGGASATGLRQYRTGKRGRVGSLDAGESLVRSSEQKRLVKEQQGKVGTAKAGWHQAAKGIGGRVRKNFVSAGGKRTTAEAFPAYVRKVSRKYSNLGGAFVGKDRVSIWTNVRHAGLALPMGKRKAAEAAAKANMRKAMGMALAKVNKKFGRRAG